MKTYYYRFSKFDKTFAAVIISLILSACMGFKSPCAWGIFILLTGIWWYKNILKQKAVVITDKSIKIDHSKPLSWKDIQGAEIKVVILCGRKMKILALIPKKGIRYTYSWLQKHNAHFGPFPIPLYGILSPKDEKEIIQTVKKHIKIK